MKIITKLKYVLKLFIFATFISERFFYYTQFKAEESDKKNIHHEIVRGYEIDFSKVDSIFSDHQLFKLPYVRKNFDEIKNFLINYWNLNYPSVTKHTHSKDSNHTYSDRVIDIDLKFKFYFLTAYDFLMTTVLVYFLYNESKIAGLLFFFDVCLKNYCLINDPSFNIEIMNLVKAHFNFKELSYFLYRGQLNILKIFNFFFTSFYMFFLFFLRKKINFPKF